MDQIAGRDMDKTEVGRQLSLWRKRRGMTLQEVADGAGYSKTYIWKLEDGQVNSLDALIKICEALDVPVSEIIKAAEEYTDHTEHGD